MAERAVDPETRKRRRQRADAELVQRAKMGRKYREQIGKTPPDPLPATIELPSDLVELDLSRALKHALERERESESYFRFMAERVPDTKLGALFMELAEVEWKHKTDLQAEYDAAAPADSFLLDL